MNRILGLLLAVIMILSTTVLAVPFQVSTVETAKEVSNETFCTDSVGKLSAVVTVKPGINMLTGTTEPLTGENTTNEALALLGSLEDSTNESFTVADDSLGIKGKAIKWNVSKDSSSDYHSITFKYGGVLQSLTGHDAVHFSFDHAKVVDLENMPADGTYSPATNLWVMNHSVAGGDIAGGFVSEHNVGWKHFEKLLNLTENTQSKNPDNFKLEAVVSGKNTVDTDLYFDNFYVVPAYKFEFRSADGADILDIKYQAFDDEGKIITSFSPEAVVFDSCYVPSWSTVKGGTAVKSVELKNENVTFYATSMIPVVTVEQEGNIKDAGDKVKLIPVVASELKDSITVSEGKWTIENENVAVIEQNADGTATVTAVSDGSTKAVFTVDGVTAEYNVKVVLPRNLKVDGIKNALLYDDFNPGDYTAMFVTLSNTELGEEYYLYYQIDEEEMGTFEIVAVSEDTHDYYFNLSKAEYWTDGQEMAMMFEGDATVEAIKLYPEYIYVPSAFEITGGNAITTEGGTLSLTAVPAEKDAADEVIWSVDNDKMATVDDNGVLTAKRNGTVTVTATSVHDKRIFATIQVIITGQPNVYILTYSAGTDDEVKGLPESDDFARGNYTLSSAVPERIGYKFLGWSLTKNGETIDSVNVVSDTTVYAVWTITDSWDFDEDGNCENLTFGDADAVVEDGICTVISSGEGVYVCDNALKLDSKNYGGFNVKMKLSGTEENITLSLEITTDDGKYTYSQNAENVGEQYIYSFDISDVEGIITGFSLKTDAAACQADIDRIEFFKTLFEEDAVTEKVSIVSDSTIDAGGYTYKIGTLEVAKGVTVTLVNGNFEVANAVGEGNIVTNGNLVYTGEAALEGYVFFETNVNTSGENITFAEVDGYQYKFSGEKYGLIVPNGETKLVQIVEKSDEDAVTMLSSKYFKVTADGAEEITVLADSIDNEEEISLRYKNPVGVRFKAGIVNTAKSDAYVKEYGFVIALKRDLVNADEQLTLDFKKVAAGSAYISGTERDIYFENDGTTTFFTGVLYGIPEDSYGVKLVCKTFMKIDVDGEEFVVYGEPVIASAYEIAKSLENRDDLTEEAKTLVKDIVEMAENGDDTSIDMGDLV